MTDLRWLDLIVASVLRDAGLRWEPDLDLRDLALRLGVSGVLLRERTAGADGRLVVDENEIFVVLNARSVGTRRRFTLAHEIGHLVLANPELKTASIRRRSGLADPERFCNAFASALLMPQWWVEQNYAEAPRRLSTIRSLSRAVGASWSAGLLRLRETLRWRESLISLRRETWGWRVERSVGLPRYLRTQLMITQHATDILEQLIGVANAERRHLALAADGPLSDATADILVASRTATAVLSLPNAGSSWSNPRPETAMVVCESLQPDTGNQACAKAPKCAGEPAPILGQTSLFVPHSAGLRARSWG